MILTETIKSTKPKIFTYLALYTKCLLILKCYTIVHIIHERQYLQMPSGKVGYLSGPKIREKWLGNIIKTRLPNRII